jgi:hypothetical protein
MDRALEFHGSPVAAFVSAAVTPRYPAAPVFWMLLASAPTRNTHKRAPAPTGNGTTSLPGESPRRFGPFSFPWGAVGVRCSEEAAPLVRANSTQVTARLWYVQVS